ncbi:phage antirepressor N-terminal domain-containing protein [Glutamicibacter sp. TV12E]|uniref:phage antirepressor N-terminal domain-containing protein n=1 Tax=Glutamicibacter sp. TV12E TaxID=3446362 RepID=UPI00403406A0
MRNIDPSGKNPTIDFAGVKIPVVYDEGRPRILMRNVIEDLGMNASGQLKNLKERREWADLKPLKAHAKGDQYRTMMTASPATLVLWLNEIRFVGPDHEDKLRQYKRTIQNSLVNFSIIAFPRSR